MFERLNEIRQMKQAYLAKLHQDARVVLRDVFTEFLDAHPNIEGLQFRAYVPYFNDGEPCTYRVRGISCKLKNGPPHKYDDGEGWSEDGYYGMAEGPDRDAVGELEDVLSSSKDIIEAVFGDNVKVEITRSGDSVAIMTSEYVDHE